MIHTTLHGIKGQKKTQKNSFRNCTEQAETLQNLKLLLRSAAAAAQWMPWDPELLILLDLVAEFLRCFHEDTGKPSVPN